MIPAHFVTCRAPPQRQRQARPAKPSQAPTEQIRAHGAHRAFVEPRSDSERKIAGSLGSRSSDSNVWSGRQLLRPRRRLDPQHPGGCQVSPPPEFSTSPPGISSSARRRGSERAAVDGRYPNVLRCRRRGHPGMAASYAHPALVLRAESQRPEPLEPGISVRDPRRSRCPPPGAGARRRLRAARRLPPSLPPGGRPLAGIARGRHRSDRHLTARSVVSAYPHIGGGDRGAVRFGAGGSGHRAGSIAVRCYVSASAAGGPVGCCSPFIISPSMACPGAC